MLEYIHLEFVNKPCSVLCMALLTVEIHLINANNPPSLSLWVKGIDQYGDAKNEQKQPEVRNPKRSNLKLCLPG